MFSNYHFESFNKNQVGSVTYRFKNGVKCKIYYPAIKPTSYYYTKNFSSESVYGLSRLLGYSSYIVRPFLNSVLDSTIHNAAVQPNINNNSMPADSNESKYSLMVFSHGLWGNSELYNNYCTKIASTGFIVVSFNHLDGTGLWNSREDGTKVEYVNPDAKHYNDRQFSPIFRKPFLEKRNQEIREVLEEIHNLDSAIYSHEILSKIFNQYNGQIYLSGHSFGAATILNFYHNQINNQINKAINFSTKIQKLVLLDPWTNCLPMDVTTYNYTIPTLIIMSEEFCFNFNMVPVKEEIMKHSSNTKVYYASDSKHQFISDISLALPWMLQKFNGTAGHKHQPIDIFREVVRKVEEFLDNDSKYSVQYILENEEGIDMIREVNYL